MQIGRANYNGLPQILMDLKEFQTAFGEFLRYQETKFIKWLVCNMRVSRVLARLSSFSLLVNLRLFLDF